jgi:sucrose-6-phosphate hydrolase SacC (GH32 family)
MVHWKWHPTVLAPPFTGHGMFSGTGFFTKEGRPVMIYHAVGSGKNALMYALDDNLDKWTKPDFIELKAEDGSGVDFDGYWDPDCWLNGDTYYAISGGKNPPMMKSDDLKKWTFMGDLLHDDYKGEPGIPRDEDISCANMFKIGDKWMLLCISHRLGCRYFLGDFIDEHYMPEIHAKMNWLNTDWEEGPRGLIYFAPESMLTGDGRRVMWAWIITDDYFSQTGIQSLPRELELAVDGVLRIKPLQELKTLRYAEKSMKNITIKKNQDYLLNNVTGDAVEVKVVFKATASSQFGMKLAGKSKNDDILNISISTKNKTLTVGKQVAPFELKKAEDLTLCVFMDKNLIEVFANDRQAAISYHEYNSKKPYVSFFTEDTDVKVKEVKAWKMKSIY